MLFRRHVPLGLAALIGLAAACSRSEPPLTPEAARTKGDAMLRQMSQTLASTQAFSYTVDEARERVKRDGTKYEDRFTRRVIVRRPSGLAFTETGEGHDGGGWYDGKHLTLVSNQHKVWARGPMPATIDEALDFISAEYAVQIPTADLLYSSPYDALMTEGTTGGWVGVEAVEGAACDHLSYSQPLVDWQLWLTQDDRRLPRKAQITYKKDPGQPVTRVVFRDWNPSPQISDAAFTAVVPAGYERIKIMRHTTVIDEKLSEGATATTGAKAPAR